MKIRILSLILALTLLCGCTPSQPVGQTQPPSPSPTASAAPHGCSGLVGAVLKGFEGMSVEGLSGDDLAFWLLHQYRLPEGSWADAAVYRASNPMYAFEIAVIRLREPRLAAQAEQCLSSYITSRQGDFFGYDPEQAAIVEGSSVVCSEGEDYVALLICEDPGLAETLFLQGLKADPATLQPPLPNVKNTPEPTPTPDPSSAPVSTMPPIKGIMSIYRTSDIIDAWHSGDPSALDDYERAIYDRCTEILPSILTDGMTDYEKEEAIYLWVVSNVTYDFDHYDPLKGASLDSSTPYNPLINGKGICMGFASTFKLLADLAGLECKIVAGRAFGEGELHAWNMVRLNGEWYCLDATWDVGYSNPRFWKYFNVTSQFMAKTDHQWDEGRYPEATATDGGKS